MNYVAAAEAIAPLVAVTPGWDDDATAAYVSELTKLGDARILADVAADLARTWAWMRRPPLADIINAYRTESARRTMALSPPNDDDDGCPITTGYRIARQTYEAECRHQRREPNYREFDRIFADALSAAAERG